MAASSVFGKILESATKFDSNTSAGTTTTLHKNFMNGIADYLDQHVTFNGTFSGTNGTSSMTSPVTCKVDASLLRPLVLSGANGWSSWVQQFYLAIRTAPVIKPASFIPAGTIPVFPSISLGWSQSQLKNTAGNNGREAHGKCMDMIGAKIIQDMKKGYIKSIPGAMGAYVGALTVSSIICD